MINPKEFFRFNATTREKKPTTTRGRTPVRTPIDDYPLKPENIAIVSDRILAPDAPTVAPLTPRPDVAVEPKPRRIGTKTRIALAGLALLETGGAIANEQFNEQPIGTQTVIQDLAWPWNLGKSAVEDIQRLFQGKTSSPEASVFDPQADKQTVKAGVNTIAVSETELKKAYEAQSAQNRDGRPTVVFPLKFTADGQRVDYEYQKPLSPFTDGTVIEFPGTIKTNLDKGMEIVVPAENAEVFQFQPQIIDGKQYFVGLWIKFQQNGETYAFGVSGADVRTFIPIGEVVNAPLVPVNKGGTLLLADAKNGLKLPVGMPVARVDRNTILEEGFNFSRYNPNNPHINARWESIRPNFVTDNSTGQLKLILPQNK